MENGCLAKVNSSGPFNYTTYTKLRTLQTFIIDTTDFCNEKADTPNFCNEKCGHYKLCNEKAHTTNFCDEKCGHYKPLQ